MRRRYASIQSGSAAARARIYIYSHTATPTVSPHLSASVSTPTTYTYILSYILSHCTDPKLIIIIISLDGKVLKMYIKAVIIEKFNYIIVISNTVVFYNTYYFVLDVMKE